MDFGQRIEVSLPKKLSTMEKNSLDVQWEVMLYDEFQKSYSKAEEKIQQDFLVLKEKLYTPLQELNSNSIFTKYNACPESVNRLKQLIEDQGKPIAISMGNDIITAERIKPENIQRISPKL